ncbi:MFS transporter [Rhodococcus sp. NPDC057529]|uniref:MFS transporter n=1 Tax=Rhodococcus sp. NPDC057529 TaxID=3346158 RepID=UPI00366AD083
MSHNRRNAPTPARTAAQPPKSKVRLAFAALIGTTIEYYDFFLYGTAAALVFNVAFFPSEDPFVSTLLAFSTLTVGFFARPIGAAVFGHFGDRLGRKRTLVASLMLMGGSTFLIAFLPTFDAIGVAAPITLIVLRLIQGFAMGGEWGGATLLLTENVDARRRGFWASFPQIGPALGNLIAAGVLAIFSVVLTDDQFLDWGWRIPFALSALLLALGLWVRLQIGETDEFLEQKAKREEQSQHTPAKIPLVTLLTRYRKPLLLAVGFRLGESAAYYITTVYILQYATSVGEMSRSLVLAAVLFAVAVEAVLVPVFGALTDRIGRRPVYAGAAIAVIPYIFLLFGVVDAGQTVGVILVVLVGGIIHAAFAGTHGAYFSELFDTEVRYSGVSLGFNLGAVLGGGLTPIIGLSLYQVFGSSVAFSAYVSVLALLTLTATLIAGETLPRLANRASTVNGPQPVTPAQ